MSELAKIAIVGAGGFGKETLVMINQVNSIRMQWAVIGFFDDGMRRGSTVSGSSVLGGVDQLNAIEEEIAVVIAVGDPRLKRKLVERIKNTRIYYPTIIHPVATIGENIKAGAGCLITAGCRLTVDITLGDFVMLNLNTTVGHDVSIGSYSSIMPGVHISGYVNVGEEVLIGTGASVLQHVSIGKQAVVGASAVVNRSVEANRTVAGVPARSIRKND
ncbi:MAG: acetyltransferase [Cyclobacteriaceae bacterium]|nr:acetyltransferase [Cyclobacteriaceae bacterium]